MNEYIAGLMKEYFASKEKLSKVVERDEDYEKRMIEEGYSPNVHHLSTNIIDLLQSIRNTVTESLTECNENKDNMMIDSLLHIDLCVSNIRVKLGLPASSFSKRCE